MSRDGSRVTASASGRSNPRLEHLAAAFSGHPSSVSQAWVGVSAAEKGTCCPRGRVSAHGARVGFSCPGVSSRELRATYVLTQTCLRERISVSTPPGTGQQPLEEVTRDPCVVPL